jgi:hypothetical protein
MKKFLPILLLGLLQFQCDGDSSNSAIDTAILKVCEACDKKPSEMKWLQQTMLNSNTDIQLSGAFFTAKYHDTTLIIHQPTISSCFTCLLFSCDGDTLKSDILPELENITQFYRSTFKAK